MFVHWIADFVLQTEEMANKKSSSNFWLTMHVSVYSLTSLGGIMIYGIFYLYGHDTLELGSMFIVFFVLCFVLHWLTDFVTSRITTYYHITKQTRKFFITIGFDQWLHLIQLLSIYFYLRIL